MTFHFSIEYQTQWGEELRVIIDGKEFAMQTCDGLKWETTLDLPTDGSMEYRYALYRDGLLVWTEWEVKPHVVRLDAPTTSYRIDDFWRAIPDDLPLYSSAFTECVASHGAPLSQALPAFNQTLQLRLVEPRLLSHQHLGICGNTTQLGNWTQPVPLTLIALQEWGVNLDAEQIYHPIEYKYVILDNEGKIVQWEDGPNRRITSLPLSDGEMWIKSDSAARFQFDNWKCAGVVIPVFSLRSEHSHGIGDFGDLKRMIRWAASAGMHAVQILPINDTTMSHTWQDSYPYNAISIYALNPIYCDLNALPPLHDRLMMETVMMRQQSLNALPEVDFEDVQRLKTDYLRKVYDQEGGAVLKTQGFKDFLEANRHWLVPYAAFCHLRDMYGTADFQTWPKYSTYQEKDIKRLTSPRGKAYPQIALHYYIQYQLHLQLTEVHETARTAGIILKGDIPIGISRTSVEAWSEPQYFNLHSQAGAPPDDFSVNGQNWGFPTYNWDAMLKDGCLWWERRFQQMAHYFDAYRIDHVLGFFRIWDIPEHSVHGLLGQFSPSLPMSQSEIESYGFRFDPVQMTRPYINDDLLYQLFSYRAELVKTLYLQPLSEGAQQVQWAPFNAFGGSNTLYRLRPEYDTQRKIQAAFAEKTTQEDMDLREGLYRLVSNVLFIPDRQHPQLYHPRIAAQNDYAIRDITWETTYTYDLGLDASLLGNRLDLAADYYYKETRDMLLEINIPSYVGYGNPSQNGGTMFTRGWEFKAGWKDRIGDFSYGASFNISDYKSIMGDLKGTVFLGDQIIKEGEEYYSWYGYKSLGIFQDKAAIIDAPTQLITTISPGDIGYKDIGGIDGNPDGVVSAAYDKTILGSSLPHYVFGGSLNLGWKNWNLGVLFNGVGSQLSRLTTYMVQPFSGQWLSPPAVIKGKYWSAYNSEEQNRKAVYPRLSESSSESNNYEMSDYWLIDGSYLRIKNINLGYTVPGSVLKKVGVKACRVYFNMDDPFCFDHYLKGWDPEQTTNSYIARTYTLGFDIKF